MSDARDAASRAASGAATGEGPAVPTSGDGGDAAPANRARAIATRALERAARSAGRISGSVEARDDLARHAAPVVRRAAGAFDSAAAYTRSRSVPEMRHDLESAIRRRPVRAIAIAFVAGYLTRRLL